MTFASKITIGRILLVPVFTVLAVAYGRSTAAGEPSETLRWWALGVFVLAAASDGVDGWVARRFGQVSKFGAFIDPLADKLLLLAGVVTLSLVDWGEPGWRLPLWFAAIVVLRDCIIVGGIRVLRSRGKRVRIEPHWSGKWTTATQMFALGWVMLRITPMPPVWPCVVAGFFTCWSAVEYVRRGLEILREPETDYVSRSTGR